MNDLANTRLGQYQLIEAIGHGGMATVYKAYQESLDRFVAVKVLLSNRDPQFAARFKREARAIAALQHHNILTIYDYGEQDGLLYFVLQYVENGVTLHDMLGKPIAPVPALRLIGHVLNALDYAHARGVVHRDIKPANILMPSPSWALLADFGIAKLLNDSQHLTMTGFIIGTAAYMAPEQAAGKPIDARTDVYSLGVVLYEMLTGRVPFDSDTPMAVLTKHVYEPPPPPRSINPDLSPVVEALLLRALAKDPNQRYQSAAEMSAELERVVTHLGRPRPSSQVTSLYQAGVEAFEQGRWEEAAERLSRLVALAPDYEDATVLLNAAKAEQDRALRERVVGGSTIERPVVEEPPRSDPTPGPAAEQAQKAAPITGALLDNFSNGLGRITGKLTRPGKAPSATLAHCPQCNLPIQPEWQVCPFCQAPIVPAQSMRQDAGPAIHPPLVDPTQPPKRSWIFWAILATAIILFGGAGGVYAWSRTNNAGFIAPAIVNTATASPTPSPSPTKTPTATPTPSPSPTATPSPTSSPTATPTETPTATPTPTPTEQPTPVPTPRPTAKPTPKPAPKQQPTPKPAAPVVPTEPPPVPTEPPPLPTEPPPLPTEPPTEPPSDGGGPKPPPKPTKTPRP